MRVGPPRRAVCLALTAVVSAPFLLGACRAGNDPPHPAAPARPNVVATTTMLGDVVRSVAGDRADVTVLMAPGDDPRTFTLPADAGTVLDGADLIVATGLGFESALQPDLDRARSARTTVLDAATLVAPMPGADGAPDPHVWMDPDRLHTIADQVADRLTALAGGDPSPWRDAANSYGADLAAADEAVQATLAPVPDDRRKLHTDSTGLAYFADRYGLTLAPVDASGALAIDVDSLGPPGSATATDAGLLTDTAGRIATWLTSAP